MTLRPSEYTIDKVCSIKVLNDYDRDIRFKDKYFNYKYRKIQVVLSVISERKLTKRN